MERDQREPELVSRALPPIAPAAVAQLRHEGSVIDVIKTGKAKKRAKQRAKRKARREEAQARN
jgi:hypothetical protein